MIHRRIDVDEGRAALAAWRTSPLTAARPVVATAVRYTLEEFAERHPGGALELRVPPYGVAQAIGGTRHTRGTPPAVVETDAATWLGLVLGSVTFPDAHADGRVRASGERSDLTDLLPLARMGS